MIIVDKYFRSGYDEVRNFKKFSTNIRKKTINALMQHEKAEKLKAFKALDYGKYITRIPSIHVTRFNDNPLPASRARSFNESNAFFYHHASEEYCETIQSQRLYGTLIPRMEHQMLQNAEEVSKQKKTVLTELKKHKGALRKDKSSQEIKGEGVTTYGSIS